MVRQFFSNRRLTLILILYLILTVSYSVVVPIGRGADEWAHYWYAQFIAENGRLPANPAEREAAGYKSDWPPLYHLFAAGLTAWIDTDGPPTFKYRANNIRRQLVPAMGPEAILHTEDEQFPWRQEILVWHLGRFLSIGFSVGTLLVTCFIALEVFAELQGRRVAESQSSRDAGSNFLIRNSQFAIRNSKSLALMSVAVLAFNPRFLFTGMLFNYDSLMLLLASIFLWLAIRVLKGHCSRWGYWGLGALAGLALVTKYLAAPLVLVIVVVALMRAVVQGSRGAGGHIPSVLRFTPALRPLGQAALGFSIVIAPWFTYLIRTFNEIGTYGPVLGTLAPLIRGDGSDRTVEQIFAWLSGGQAPAPAHIDQQSYTAWQIIAELPTTFWGNPITRLYPLTWFVIVMSLFVIVAAIGLLGWWRSTAAARPPSGQTEPNPVRQTRQMVSLLLLHAVLPVPFMVIRLFGARDVLEAVQGRHILFLAGPAVAILLVWGVAVIISSLPFHISRFSVALIIGLLLTGAVGQLIFMEQAYPDLLPIHTNKELVRSLDPMPEEIILAGGARTRGYSISRSSDQVLHVAIFWEGGQSPAPEDYQLELALVDQQNQARAGWLAYQTQAHYPTRAWEAGDVIRDDAWLPLIDVSPGNYEIRLRLAGQDGEVIPWQTLTTYTQDEAGPQIDVSERQNWHLWRHGQIVSQPSTLRERETAYFTNYQLPASALRAGTSVTNYQLIGPNDRIYPPAASGPTWANFIIGPDWPAGEYFADGNDRWPLFRVAANQRRFELPPISHPLEVNFEGKIKLLGYDLPTRRVEPGGGLPITLYWQGLRWMGEEFVIFERLLDNQGLVWGGYDRLAQENYSTLLWAPGEIVTDGFAVPVAADAPPGVYRLSLGWYRRIDGEAQSLSIIDPETGIPIDATAVTIGPIKVGGPPAGVTVEEVVPQNPVKVSFGDQFELIGFNSKLNTQNLELSLYWRAQRQPEADYSVFVHVRNQAGEIVTQKDQLLTGGVYPSSLWDTGEIINDDLIVPLDNLAPGQYQVVIGLYDFAADVRLPVGGAAKNEILLTAVVIES